MSQTSLIEKITQDAAIAVAQIEAATAAEIETITQDIRTAVEAKKNANEAALKKELMQHELVAISKAKQAGNIAFQSAKRHEINTLFAELEAEIVNMNEAEYVSFVTAIAGTVLPEKAEVTKVLAPASRVGETEKILTDLHLQSEIQSAPITAGIIVHAKDGVYDASIDRLITERRPELEIELMRMIETK